MMKLCAPKIDLTIHLRITIPTLSLAERSVVQDSGYHEQQCIDDLHRVLTKRQKKNLL